MFAVVSRQMLVMGIFLVIGALFYKTKLISHDGSKTMTNMLIYLITPVVVFRSFCTERTPEKVNAFLISFALCTFVQAFGILFARAVYKKRPTENFAICFPNAGFFGIPVIQACLGTEAVFYMAPLAVFVGILQHSYGVSLLLGTKKSFEWKRVFLAPGTIALVAGIIVFLTGLGTKIPPLLNQCLDIISTMNAFFAMAILGIFLVQSDLTQLFKNKDIYIVCALRSLVIPFICALIFRFIPVDYVIRYTILFAFAGPVGTNVASYSLLFDKDYSKASLYVAVSTIFSLGTLPLFATILEHILI